MAADDSRAQVQLDEDTLARRRRDLGADHPDTLAAASNLVMTLDRVGEEQAARELAEDILARRRRVLGEDHPDTLAAAFQLVGALTELGEHHAARELNDDIIARRRRVLGDEHPETIMAGAFDLILRGLDLGGEPEWMAALREAARESAQHATTFTEGNYDHQQRARARQPISIAGEGLLDQLPDCGRSQRGGRHVGQRRQQPWRSGRDVL